MMGGWLWGGPAEHDVQHAQRERLAHVQDGAPREGGALSPAALGHVCQQAEALPATHFWPSAWPWESCCTPTLSVALHGWVVLAVPLQILMLPQL